jgi:plasmid segregation protein ParM
MFVVAMDVGYSSLKILAGMAGTAPAVTILPAGAGPLAAMPDRLGRGRDDRDLVVSVDGAAWAAGVEPGRLQNWERELHPDYPATAAYRALFHAALLVSGRERVDRLVTGLPVAQHQDTARRERLRAALIGVHQVTPERQVTVEQVDILAQPVGAYLDAIGSAAAAAVFNTARTLVIDAGFFSVDWMLIDGGELRSANSGSSTSAMSLLIEAADDLIQQDRGDRLGLNQIEKALRAGSGTVPLFGSPVELAPYLTAAAKRTASAAITAVRRSMRSERRAVDVVLLTGGGAAIYADAAREAYPRSQVVVSADPVLANACGFWDYVQDGPAERAAAAPVVSAPSAEPTPEPVAAPEEPAGDTTDRGGTAERDAPVVSATSAEPTPEPIAVPEEPAGDTTDRGDNTPGTAERDAAAPVVSATSAEPTPEPIAVPEEPAGDTTDRGDNTPSTAGRGRGRTRRARGG